MSIRRLPRVVFSAELPPPRRARKRLAEALRRCLSSTFGPIQSFQLPLVPVTVLRLKIAQRNFVVAIKRLKRKGVGNGEWKIRVDPLDYPSRLKGISSDEERKLARDLMAICGAVDTVLKDIPTVARLRWYFVGWNASIPGVSTPAELPWHLDVPELTSPHPAAAQRHHQ